MEDDPHLPRLLNALPRRARLRLASARLIRWPRSILLIVGEAFGFLPVLGFWMAPSNDYDVTSKPLGT
jgi:hypothetical protein